MISEYKPQAPNYKLLENSRETPYRGNLRAFCEEAERRRQILISKLHFEGRQPTGTTGGPMRKQLRAVTVYTAGSATILST
ncbi:hypothetical protein KR026_011730 [Drosophila bipectinata]|nr:hypothetical protein KR026_011730 [Drosophila bipectinata]